MSKSQQVAAEALRLLQTALEESEARVEQLEKELRGSRADQHDSAEGSADLQDRLEQSENERRRYQVEVGRLEDVVEHLNAQLDELRAKLDIAESGPEKLTKKEINFWRAKAESFDEQAADYTARIVALRGELDERQEVLAGLRIAAELAPERASVELGAMREKLERAEWEARSARAEAETARAEQASAAAAMGDVAARSAKLENEIEQLRDELREERECAENLSEVANNRLDELNKSREQQEEAQERLEESEWRLRRARHFERLVHRRKNLIAALIATIRAKAKANTALKAGLDSLRRYKASAQASEQKLLAEIDRIKVELGKAKESRERYQDTTPNRRRSPENGDRIKELEQRVKSQAEIIGSFEEQLKVARVVQSELTNKAAEAQREIDAQRTTLGSAAAASFADREADRLMIEALEQEVAQLTEEAESWKRKYEFLSAETPDAYRDQAAAEK